MKDKRPFDYEDLIDTIDEDVAYFMIPKMIGYDDYPDFEIFFETYLRSLKINKPHGLIIDIRGNSGGTRDLIQTLSKYIVNQNQSPWVANMAFVRSDQYLDEDISSMDSKNLFTYHSTAFDDSQREAIDQFKKEVNLKFQFDRNKFSQPYFMVLNYHGSLYLDLPIYILCDEGSFSAASIIASVFKGLNNVQVCGTTTNGSSGRSGRFSLPNFKIQLKLSTMLSFQKNGLPLDGYGTIPDIVIPRDEQQILGKQDSQLKTLIEIIKTRHNKQ